MANQAPFMTKELNKEIMTRLRLRNSFLRFRSEEKTLMIIKNIGK